MKKQSKNNVVIFQAKNGAIELRADISNETIWATQSQMAELFGVNSQAISKHLNNIYKEAELSIKSTCSKMEQVQSEGVRKVARSVQIYNLDAMISVGYRINSKVGTKFRQWATRALKSHIVDGYTINPSRINQNYGNFIKAVEDVKRLLPKNSVAQTEDILDLIKMFASTWFSLDAYDKQSLPKSGSSKKKVNFTARTLYDSLDQLKAELIDKKEATYIFAQEKQTGNLEGIVGNVLQSFGGKNVYPTIEEKAAHLLYFIVKNHPFTDGNKRSGAFAFIWFLKQHQQLNQSVTPEALTVLTLLIAESNPKDKDRMIGLVLLLLKKG